MILHSDPTPVLSASPEDWPFRVAELSGELEDELADPVVLIAVVDQLTRIAEDHQCQSIAGASPMGTQLAGALVARAGNGLRLFSTNNPTERVLVIDGLLATGTQAIKAARAALQAGASHVTVAAVLANREALDSCREALAGELVVLEAF